MNMIFKRGEAEKSSYLIPSGVLFLFFKLEDNCFTILCWFLPYISMNQPQVYLCPLPSETPPTLLLYLHQSHQRDSFLFFFKIKFIYF